MSCITAQDPQLARLAKAIAQKVGSQRFHVWFNNSTRLDLKQDELEIAVPNDFISEWINKNFTRPIQEAANDVLGHPLTVRFNVVPQLFEVGNDEHESPHEAVANLGGHERPSVNGYRSRLENTAPHTALLKNGSPQNGVARFEVDPDQGGVATIAVAKPLVLRPQPQRPPVAVPAPSGAPTNGHPRPKLRHDIESFVVGPTNQLAYNAAVYVAEFPGAQYNPLFIHGVCGLGKTHLLQGLCRRFLQHHPTKRWAYITGEDFTNDFVTALRSNKLEAFRRRMRDLDLLAIDDVHFLAGKKATQEEFLHTFNSIEASGRQVVMASDSHPKMIEEFGESLVNRFVSGMVVRIDSPNFQTRCEILRALAARTGFIMPEDVTCWIARRVTQNVRELEGAITRIAAHVRIGGRPVDVSLAQEALGDLDRQLVAPVKPESILQAVCTYFGVEGKDLMSGRRQRTVSLARSIAMYLVRKTAKLSFPEIGQRMGKRNHSTVISACRRIERAMQRNESLVWASAVGERTEEAAELLQRLEDHSRVVN